MSCFNKRLTTLIFNPLSWDKLPTGNSEKRIKQLSQVMNLVVITFHNLHFLVSSYEFRMIFFFLYFFCGQI